MLRNQIDVPDHTGSLDSTSDWMAHALAESSLPFQPPRVKSTASNPPRLSSIAPAWFKLELAQGHERLGRHQAALIEV